MPISLNDSDTIPIPTVPTPEALEAGTMLPVPFISQRSYQYLCWAACCAMVDLALARQYPQQCGHLPATVEDTAQMVLDSHQCPSEFGSGFDRTCWPDCACHALGVFCLAHDSPMPHQYLQEEIATGRRPVMIYIQWDSVSAHVVLVCGCSADGTQYLVHDPRTGGPVITSAAKLGELANSGAWRKTYYRVGASL